MFSELKEELMKILAILLMVLLVACSPNVIYKTKDIANLNKSKVQSESGKSKKIEKKGKIFYYITSYYGKKFHGRYTASGEIYDMYKLTCAHRTLPFGTKLKVTNEDNGKSVIVRVNDRGPNVSDRDLDISYVAAQKIGLIGAGIKKLRVEIVKIIK